MDADLQTTDALTPEVIPDVGATAAEWAPLVVEELVSIALHATSTRDRLRACQYLIDRIHGAPAQSVTTDGSVSIRVVIEEAVT